MQKCARRAHEYELLYLQLLTDDDKELHILEIEKMKKEIKCKRCSLDQDFAICEEMVDSMAGDDLYEKEEVVNEEFCVIKDVESTKEKMDTF